jgi:membrane glycosyltransferase
MRERDAIRWSFMGLVLATVAAGATGLWNILRVDGVTPLEGAFLALFVILCTRNSTSFWMSCAGAYALSSRRFDGGLSWPADADPALRGTTSRTAIVMPICDEDVARVFAGLVAMHDSVIETGAADRFDFFVLSDTRKDDCYRAELVQWRRLREEGRTNIYYRRRTHNHGRKSGNIAEFCENWGALYDYMAVLDADSLMTGRTLATLVRLMDENPRAALIQVPPLLMGRVSLFARLQQFAASVYGPLFAAGFALIHGSDGNYWGHNAIIRVEPFMLHCGLPKLPGRPPLGGDILSHDFVEAALLRRAGWELHMVPQLGGSFEEPPPTLMDYLKRDRRWCQGNLQHLRLIFAQGFRLPSRMHLLSGAMAYLTAPLWVLMLAAAAAGNQLKDKVESVSYIGRYPVLAWPISHTVQFASLIFAMIALLFGPKLLALAMLVRNRDACRAHGGRLRATLSVILESAFSMLIAPVAMISHCWFVASILGGRAMGWRSQKRREYRPSMFATVQAFVPHTVIAVATAFLLHEFVPETFWWFAPILIGAALAIPLAYGTSSRRLGLLARRMGLLLVPSETVDIPIIRRLEKAQKASQSLSAA